MIHNETLGNLAAFCVVSDWKVEGICRALGESDPCGVWCVVELPLQQYNTICLHRSWFAKNGQYGVGLPE